MYVLASDFLDPGKRPETLNSTLQYRGWRKRVSNEDGGKKEKGRFSPRGALAPDPDPRLGMSFADPDSQSTTCRLYVQLTFHTRRWGVLMRFRSVIRVIDSFGDWVSVKIYNDTPT
jgi:hypothetical protein